MQKRSAVAVAQELGTAVSGETVYTGDGSIRENFAPGSLDPYYVSPETRKEFGIRDDETPAWIRDPERWTRDEKSDRWRTYRQEHRSARVPTDENGERLTTDDLLLVVRSTAAVEQEQAIRDRMGDQYAESTAPSENGETDHSDMILDYKSGSRPLNSAQMEDKQTRRQLYEQNYRMHRETGAIKAEGMTEQEALRKYTPEQILAEEARWRRGATRASYSDAEWTAQMTATDRNGRRVFGVGSTGLGKTTAQKIAARKGAR